jgi:hypothetical protein
VGKVIKGLLTAAVLIGVGIVLGPATLASVLVATGVSMALATTSQALFGPKTPKGQLSRLNASFDPQAARKFVIGETAMNTDIRYYEPSGTDQEYFDYIIATAAHEVESIDQIYFDDVLAWSSSGGVTATYSGYLTVTTRLVGTSANTIAINGGGIWGSSCRLTGCSYIHFRVKRTGNTKKAESPLVNGLPTRITIKGKGAKLYDPRRDSTVAGGSGSERANDQTTWGGGASTNRDNPALQLLWFLLGWKINGKLSVGCGVPYERIDMPSFITAANICDEAIALSGGGTQPRYRTAGAGSDADGRMDVIQLFLTCMNGTLRDSGGRLSLQVMKNDLATPVLEFDDNDILDDFTWNQTNGLDKSINAVHGKYTDPTANSLYQPVEYPSISIASADGIERLQTLDLPWVEDGKRAQRIAKQVLQRAQYRGTFSANFTAKALGCKVGDVVYLTFGPLGWSNKPFRILTQVISSTGRVPMTMIEENAAIYAWDAEEKALVTATAPTVYDPLNSPYILGISDAEAIADGKITSFYQASAPTAEGVGDIWIDTDDSNKLYRWDGSAWVLSRDTGITTAIDAAADAQATADGKVTTFYAATAPTAEAVGDLWFDTDDNVLYRWNGSTWGNNVSDITSANQITFSEVDPFSIQANSAGVTTTTLPVTRGIKVFRGGVEQTSGVTLGTVTATSGITASASVSSGAVTVSVSVANAVGYVTVPIIFGGVTYPRLLVVNRTIAAPIAGGAAGSTSFTDQTWTQVSSTSFVAVTDANAQILSDSSGRIRLQANASYTGTGTAEIKTQYSANNSTWTDVATGTGSTASDDPFEPEPGFVNVGPDTVTGLTASTNYYVRLVARETTSGANFSWSYPSFTADQP